MKIIIYTILFYINLLGLVLGVFHMVLFYFDYSEYILELLLHVRMISTYFILVFWIWNMIIWGQKDKKAKRFIALFFLSAFYTLYYYRLVRKNNWLNQ